MSDSFSDLPLWLRLLTAALGACAAVWGAIIAFVDPWADARYMRRVARCSDRLERHMRTKMFAEDLARVHQRDEKIEAITDRLTKIDAVQLAMGDALRDLPAQIKVLERLAYTMEAVNGTMAGLQDEVKALANEHHEMRGMIEGWREPSPGNPLRPRRSRKPS